MVRTTPIEAFKKMKSKGLLSKKRLEVYRGLAYLGPGTASEIATQMKLKGLLFGNIRARLLELKALGVAKENGYVRCPVTGHRAIHWEAVGALPLALKTASKVERLKIKERKLALELAQIRREIQALKETKFTRGQLDLFTGEKPKREQTNAPFNS